jgi:ribosomal protein S27E
MRYCKRCINGKMFFDRYYQEWECVNCGHIIETERKTGQKEKENWRIKNTKIFI